LSRPIRQPNRSASEKIRSRLNGLGQPDHDKDLSGAAPLVYGIVALYGIAIGLALGWLMWT